MPELYVTVIAMEALRVARITGSGHSSALHDWVVASSPASSKTADFPPAKATGRVKCGVQ
jgi:hypothetical protein